MHRVRKGRVALENRRRRAFEGVRTPGVEWQVKRDQFESEQKRERVIEEYQSLKDSLRI